MIFARETASSNRTYFTAGPEHLETPTIHDFLCVDKLNSNPPNGNATIVETGSNIESPF